MKENYLSSVIKQFEYYKMLGEKTFEQLPAEKLFVNPGNQSNSIAVIVKHLSGNMLSRWSDFLTSDGEKPWRNRDGEFEEDIKTKNEMMEYWNKGWECFLDALGSLKPGDLEKTVYIRSQGHTVMEAINRQLSHYSYHIGQIVYAGKIYSGNWKTLSIAKGESSKFNDDKFSKPKHNEHFTDEFTINKK